MDVETLDLLEYHQVLEIIAGFTRTPQGREAVLGIRPQAELEAINDFQLQIAETDRLQSAGLAPSFDLPDPQSVLSRLQDPGSSLAPEDFLVLRDYLSFASSVRETLQPDEYPRLFSLLGDHPLPVVLQQRIENTFDERGRIRDSAQPELAAARRHQDEFRRKTQEHLERFLKGSRAKFLIDDPFVTQRAHRYVIPLRVEHQKDVPGIVHGASSSGATVFVEPFSVVELNNQLIFYTDRESEIIQTLLKTLSAEARRQINALVQIIDATAALECRFACVRFADSFSCCTAQIGPENEVFLQQARHPLLVRALGDRRVVPIDAELTPDEPVLVISGPNTGGKTASLKTIGLICLLAHSGIPVPAREARIPLLSGIHADIGDHQSITQQLSSFSAHIARLRELILMSRSHSLLLLDELGRGTDPTYGSALAIAVLEHFRRLGNLVLATTHHRAVKSWAALTTGVRNASVGLDPMTQKPTYVLEFGVAGESSGLEIAAQVGLPAEVIDHARSLLGDRESLVEGYLRELRQHINLLREKEADLARKIEDQEEAERARRRQFDLQRQQNEKQAEKLLERLAKEFREEGNRFVKRIQDQEKAREVRKQAQIREAALKESFRRKVRSTRAPETASGHEEKAPLSVGDFVYHPEFRVRGRVLSVDGPSATIDVDGKALTTRTGELRKIEKESVVERPSSQVTIHIVRNTDPELNLVGKTVDEAEAEIDKFLDRAFVSRLSEVTIIHGFGTGKLKSFVSRFLSSHPQVESYQVEGGVTRAQLKT